MKNKNEILRIPFVTFLLRCLYPNWSYCKKCGLPYSCCTEKSVMYSEHSGTFATCDICWDNSTLEELKIYYTIVFNNHRLSAIKSGYEMDHSLDQLLNSVEKEYYSTRSHINIIK